MNNDEEDTCLALIEYNAAMQASDYHDYLHGPLPFIYTIHKLRIANANVEYYIAIWNLMQNVNRQEGS